MSRIKDSAVQAAAISALHHNDRSTSQQPSPQLQSSRDDSDTISIRSRHTLRAFGAQNGDDDEEEDPWSAIPRRNNFGSIGATTMGGSGGGVEMLTSAKRKQLILRALLQLLALFVVCLVGLGGTLWLALPVISDEDQKFFKIPRNFDDLKNLNTVLQHYKNDHFFQVLLCWFIVYMFLQAFSIPGSMYMSILAGALFGVPIALPLVCTSVATGATICYLISKFLGVVLVALPSWSKRIDEWKDKLDEHAGGTWDLVSYLIVIRMMPLPPHNIVNILSPHLGISIPTFWISTFFGIFAVSVIHTTIGEKLDQMSSPDDFHLFSLRNVLLLIGVCAAVMVPVVVKKLAKVDSLETTQEQQRGGGGGRGQVFLADDDDEEEDLESRGGGGARSGGRLPDSFRRNYTTQQRFFAEDDDEEDDDQDDELPRRNLVLNTSNLGAEHEDLEVQDSFPSWRDPSSSVLEEEEQEGEEDEFGRGGVFSDRHSPRSANVISADGTAANSSSSTRGGKIKAWFGSSTGIKL